MNFYADSAYPVRADLAEIHGSQLEKLGAPGTWGTGAQRLAVAAAARDACYEAGILEPPEDEGAAIDLELPEVVRRVAQQVAATPKDVDQAFYQAALADGLSDAEYTEIVGVVSRLSSFDVFARSIGVTLQPLPEPQPGTPSRERPAAAVIEQAWVPTVPNPPEGGETADALYGGKPKPYIMRALTLVPDEFRAHIALEQIQYTRLDRIMDYAYQHHEGLTRPQTEVVAGRVSALNECFY
jgi:hypothetical protein